jgi:hypothetical protein
MAYQMIFLYCSVVLTVTSQGWGAEDIGDFIGSDLLKTASVVYETNKVCST